MGWRQVADLDHWLRSLELFCQADIEPDEEVVREMERRHHEGVYGAVPSEDQIKLFASFVGGRASHQFKVKRVDQGHKVR